MLIAVPYLRWKEPSKASALAFPQICLLALTATIAWNSTYLHALFQYRRPDLGLYHLRFEILPAMLDILYSAYFVTALPGLGYVVAHMVYNVYFHPLRQFPGPILSAASSIPYALMIMSGQAHRKVAELHEKYGKVVRITPNELSFTNADAWCDIFGHRKSGQEEHMKDPVFNAPFTGTIIGADRESHRRMRRILSHGFSAQAMLEQQPMINGYIDLLIQRLYENGENGRKALDMVSWYNWTTFDIIADLAFGELFGCLQNSDYHPWVSAIFGAMKRNALLGLIGRYPLIAPILASLIPKSVRRKAQQHTDLAKAKVDKRLAAETSRPDFIQAMLLKGDMRMSTEEIYENSGLLIGAGSETTATALSTVTYFLTKHSRVRARLAEEVRMSFATESEINIQSVQKLDYMLAVLNETLRLHPPSPISNLRRVCRGGDFICGRFVPDDTSLGVWYWATFRSSDNFSLPDSFIPERWLGDDRFVNDKEALQPFSYGPRNCIGKNLAYVEMRIILARTIWNFDLTLAEDSQNWMDEEEVYTLWNKGALNVYLKPRKQ